MCGERLPAWLGVRRRAGYSNAWPHIPYCKKSPALVDAHVQSPRRSATHRQPCLEAGMAGIADMLKALLVAVASYRRWCGFAIGISDLAPPASARGAAPSRTGATMAASRAAIAGYFRSSSSQAANSARTSPSCSARPRGRREPRTGCRSAALWKSSAVSDQGYPIRAVSTCVAPPCWCGGALRPSRSSLSSGPQDGDLFPHSSSSSGKPEAARPDQPRSGSEVSATSVIAKNTF